MHRLSFARLSLALLASGVLTAIQPASAQNLFVGGNGYVEQFTHDGTDLGVFYKDPIGNRMGHTRGLTFDSSGNLLVISDAKYGIVKLSPTGAYLGSLGAGPNAGYDSLATDAFGSVFAANTFLHTVDKFSASGAALGTFAALSPGNLRASGMAFDKSGNLFVSDSQYGTGSSYFSNTIRKYAPDGTSLGVFATPDSGEQAQSLAFNKDGTLFAGLFSARGFNGQLEKFSPTGTDLGRFQTNFGIYDPIQFAFDASNNLFVDDNGGILEYDPSGNVVGQGPGKSNIYMGLGSTGSGFAFAPSAPSPVPETATTVSLGLLLALGLGGLVVSRRRRSAP